MRRWFEFGWDGNAATPKFVETSNTTKRRDQFASDFPPIFISMPFKADLLNILQGTSLADFPNFQNFPAMIKSGGGTDPPLVNAGPGDNCNAEHVVNGANPYGWRIDQFYTGGFWQMLQGGFPKPAGGFTSPMFVINLEPPSENG